MSQSCQPWKIFRWEESSTQNESGREENEEKKKEDAAKEHSKKPNPEDVTSIIQPCISGPTIPGTSTRLGHPVSEATLHIKFKLKHDWW